MITQSDVQTRLDALRDSFNKTKANLEAIHGAIVDCEYWLTQVTAEEGTSESPSPSGTKTKD